MADLNLVLKLKLNGETDCQVTAAQRIRIDGRGLIVVDSQGYAHTIQTSALESFSIVKVKQSRTPAPMAVAV